METETSGGSRWRKWDLHIHTPETKLNNQYQLTDGGDVWDKFCDEIENSDVEVFGITDYFSFDNYFLFLEKFQAKFEKSKKSFFPNLELRVDRSSNNRNEGYDFHIIFSNKIARDKLQDFLRNLQLENTNTTNGAHIKASELNAGDFESAFTSLTKIQQALKDTFGESKPYLTCLMAHGHGGVQPENGDSRKYAIAEETDRMFGNIFFGCDQKDRDFLLGTRGNSSDEKPLVTGSDAHSFNDIATKVGKVFSNNTNPTSERKTYPTWIKADVTFDGLRQVIFEPRERIAVQENSPYRDINKVFFSQIKLSGSTNFILQDFDLPLNRELIAVIGGRGSGKSALLETFAFLNEKHLRYDQNNKKKIIEYYRDNEDRRDPIPNFELTTTLVDKDSNASSFNKKLDDKTNFELPFLYLGQEQLSKTATNDFELTQTVCELIGIDSFGVGQDALITKARSILADIDNTEKQIEELKTKYTEYGYAPTSTTDGIIDWINKYLIKLSEQQARLSSKETRSTLEDINKKTKRGLDLKELFDRAASLLILLRNPDQNTEIEKFNVELTRLYPVITPIPAINTDAQKRVLTDAQVAIKSEMDELRKDIVAQKNILIKQGIKEDVNSLLQASRTLQLQIAGIERDRAIYTDGQKRLEELTKERNSLLSDIKKAVEELRDQISEKFKEFQDSREDSPEQEKDLFEKIINGIGVEGEIVFNFKRFSSFVLEHCFDKRTVSNEADLRKMIAGQNSDGTPREVTFENLSAWVKTDNEIVQKVFTRGGFEELLYYVFTKWPEFLHVKATAKLNGKPTEVLSIGQRGTLLLKVYLATSTAKQVFIIDQPEDNLDNNFIMNELVPLIRRAKKSRQIIMSTHNANLVVNADAEQVIVAKLDDQEGGGRYLSGSIENNKINQNIRDILEGGEQAFLQRERKYLFVK